MSCFQTAATFTPAAASHTNGDVNGGVGTFSAAALDMASDWLITRATLRIDGGTVETTAWTLHLYSSLPTTIADDAAYALADADRSTYLGTVALAQVVDLGGTLYIENEAVNKQFKSKGGTLYGFLVNGTTLTPQAVAHVVTLYGKSL